VGDRVPAAVEVDWLVSERFRLFSGVFAAASRSHIATHRACATAAIANEFSNLVTARHGGRWAVVTRDGPTQNRKLLEYFQDRLSSFYTPNAMALLSRQADFLLLVWRSNYMMTSSKKILITGVAGFLGSHLLDKLLASGHEVTGIDNLSMGKQENIGEHLQRKSFQFLQMDVTDAATFENLDTDLDCLVHLAAFKIPRYGNAIDTLRINYKGVENVLEFARRVKCKCVLASTSDVYGRNPKLPFNEDNDSVLGSSKVARWSYAVSKLFDEHLAFAYQESFGFPVTVLRFFGSYGPRHHLSWWGGPQSVFIDAVLNDREIPIHGDGLQTRSFTYSSDTVDGIYAAIVKPEANGEIINIGSTHEITIIDLAKTIKRLSRTPGDLKLKFVPYESFTGRQYEDVRRRVPDVSRCERILGVKAKIGLEEGLLRTIEWQRSVAHPQEKAAHLSAGVGLTPGRAEKYLT
jgi:UDP-glucose 4-epimerase